MRRRNLVIGGIVALVAIGAIAGGGGAGDPQASPEPVAQATAAPTAEPTAEPTVEPTPEPTPEPVEPVTFTGKRSSTTKAQDVAEGDYLATITAKGCDGNLILALTEPGAGMFSGESLVNDIPSGKFSGETYLYGLAGGRYVVDGTVASCDSFTVVLTPTE